MKKSKTITSCHNFIEDYFFQLRKAVDKLDKNKVELVAQILFQAYKDKRQVFIMGNGGSASTASHMACDLGKGTLKRVYDEKEERFKVYSLTDNVALLSAFANDLSFEDIFVQQLRNLVEKDDVVMALSGSGNSLNLIKAIKYAKKRGAKTVGLLGFKTGGKLAAIVDYAIVVDSVNYGICEDIQLIVNHLITSWLARIK